MELEKFDLRQQARELDITFKRLQSWRRRLASYRSFLSEALNKIICRRCFVWSRETHLEEFRQDFVNLLSQMEVLADRVDKLMSVVTFMMTISESKKSLQQDQSLTRLTIFGVMFGPLTFISSLLSMNDDVTKLKNTIWVYFSSAASMTVFILLFTACLRKFNIPPKIW